MNEDLKSVVQNGLSIWYESSFKTSDIPKEFSVAFELYTAELDSRRDSFRHIVKGELPGLQGISADANIKFNWLGMGSRNAMLIMDGKKLIKLNKMTRIMYDNPDYLVSSGLRALARLFGNPHTERGVANTLNNFSSYIITALKQAGNKKTAALNHDMDYRGQQLSTREFTGWKKVQNVATFAKAYKAAWLKHTKPKASGSHWTASSDRTSHKIMSEMSISTLTDILRKALELVGKTYTSEAEWLLKSDKLKVPSGSRLLILSQTEKIDRSTIFGDEIGEKQGSALDIDAATKLFKQGKTLEQVKAASQMGVEQAPIVSSTIKKIGKIHAWDQMIKELPKGKYKIQVVDSKKFAAAKDKYFTKRYA